MKRLIILLAFICISITLSATDVASGTLDVQLSVTPESWGKVELRDSYNTEAGKYNVYNSTETISLSVDNNLYGTGKAYLYFYAIGPSSLKVKVEILSPLKQGSSASALNSFQYSITFNTSGEYDSSSKWQDYNWQGGSFNNSSINSQDTTTASASTNGDNHPEVQTSGICMLTFKTLSTIQGKSFGNSYTGEIKVTLESS
jgi:hypothetical protein